MAAALATAMIRQYGNIHAANPSETRAGALRWERGARDVREHTPLRGRRGHGEAWQWPLGARVAGVVGTGQHWA